MKSASPDTDSGQPHVTSRRVPQVPQVTGTPQTCAASGATWAQVSEYRDLWHRTTCATSPRRILGLQPSIDLAQRRHNAIPSPRLLSRPGREASSRHIFFIDISLPNRVFPQNRELLGGKKIAATRPVVDFSLPAGFDTSGIATVDFSGGNHRANAVATDGLGRITVAGSVLRSGYSDLDLSLFRLLPDGSFDSGFGASGTIQTDVSGSGSGDSVNALALTPAGGVIVAGSTLITGGNTDFAIARYNPGGQATQRLYALQDANFNVTALADAEGTIVQRFQYDPYGKSTVLSAGWLGTSDGYDWLYRHQGGRLETATGKYSFRFRDYDPELGRWMEEDPAGYVDGANRYSSYLHNPIVFGDAYGLSGETAAFLKKVQEVAEANGVGTGMISELQAKASEFEIKRSNTRDETNIHPVWGKKILLTPRNYNPFADPNYQYPHLAPYQLGQAYNESFHMWYYFYVEDGKCEWLAKMIHSEAVVNFAGRTIYAEEAMSEMIDFMAQKEANPNSSISLAMKQNGFGSAGHTAPTEVFHKDYFATVPLQVELRSAAIWVMQYGTRDPDPTGKNRAGVLRKNELAWFQHLKDKKQKMAEEIEKKRAAQEPATRPASPTTRPAAKTSGC